jgi:cytochrome c oxidase cbb3-type subunit III
MTTSVQPPTGQPPPADDAPAPRQSTRPRSIRPWSIWGTGVVAVLLASWMGYHWYESSQDAALLRIDTTALQQDTKLLAYAARKAAPLFQEHCASCHGTDMKGHRAPDPQAGVPNLRDSVWLYGTGQIADIEATILYGIRSGNPRSHNLAEMPGFGRSGQLKKDEINDVVEYVLMMSHQQYDAEAAERGRVVFNNQGVCYDCHGADGYGVSDYGSTPLTGRGNTWLYGGDRATLRKTVFDGRHGKCPAWIHALSFADIRALAAYIYQQSHTETKPAAAATAAQPGA